MANQKNKLEQLVSSLTDFTQEKAWANVAVDLWNENVAAREDVVRSCTLASSSTILAKTEDDAWSAAWDRA